MITAPLNTYTVKALEALEVVVTCGKEALEENCDGCCKNCDAKQCCKDLDYLLGGIATKLGDIYEDILKRGRLL